MRERRVRKRRVSHEEVPGPLLTRKFSLNPTVNSIGQDQRGLLAGLRRGWFRPDNGGFTSNHTVKHKSPPDRKVAQAQPPATKARYRSVFDPGCNYPVPRSLRPARGCET